MQTRPETVDFVARASQKVVVEREIGAPPDRVFEVIADAPGWTKWWPGMRECAFTSEQHSGIGTTRRVRLQGLNVHERVVAWEPGRSWGFTWLTVNLPLARAAVELVELEPRDSSRTLLRYTIALEGRPPLSWVWSRTSRQFARGIEAGLDGLDDYVKSAE